MNEKNSTSLKAALENAIVSFNSWFNRSRKFNNYTMVDYRNTLLQALKRELKSSDAANYVSDIRSIGDVISFDNVKLTVDNGILKSISFVKGANFYIQAPKASVLIDDLNNTVTLIDFNKLGEEYFQTQEVGVVYDKFINGIKNFKISG